MSVCICIKKKEEGGLVVVNSISVYSNITFFLLLLSKPTGKIYVSFFISSLVEGQY